MASGPVASATKESAKDGCPSAEAIQSTPDSKEKRVRTISLARLARR
jgi:hypothetical protein